MSALTPDCDPDLSTCGSPTGSPGGGVRSTVVLLALVTRAVFAVTGGAVAFLAGGVGLVSALVLGRRAVRFVQRGVAAHGPWAGAVHRSRPVG